MPPECCTAIREPCGCRAVSARRLKRCLDRYVAEIEGVKEGKDVLTGRRESRGYAEESEGVRALYERCEVRRQTTTDKENQISCVLA